MEFKAKSRVELATKHKKTINKKITKKNYHKTTAATT